jgi:hypothetical protein
MPTSLTDMNFNDYVMLIGHGDNWDRFRDLFKGDRARTRADLELVRDLRNDVFHFRHKLNGKDHENLARLRGWVLGAMSSASIPEDGHF